jgi:hypothetical protein
MKTFFSSGSAPNFPLKTKTFLKHVHHASYQLHNVLADLTRALNRTMMRGWHKRNVFNNDVQLAHSVIHWRDHNLSDIVKDNLEFGV